MQTKELRESLNECHEYILYVAEKVLKGEIPYIFAQWQAYKNRGWL